MIQHFHRMGRQELGTSCQKKKPVKTKQKESHREGRVLVCQTQT